MKDNRNQDEVLLSRLGKEMAFLISRLVDIDHEINELNKKIFNAPAISRIKITWEVNPELTTKQ